MKKDGFHNFGFHTFDSDASKITKALDKERSSFAAFALTKQSGGLAKIDPETAARHHLQLMMASSAVPEMDASEVNKNKCEFRSLGTETIPLTDTKTVKFRQTYDKIPVYGSLITIEMDEDNELLAVNSSIGAPTGVNGIAKISPQQAINAVREQAGYGKESLTSTPRLIYYFNSTANKWHLAFMIEDVPQAAAKKDKKPTQQSALMDYFVDAQTGKIIAKRPRTPNVSVVEPGVDGLGKTRDIRCIRENNQLRLHDDLLNVHTHDLGFQHILSLGVLPGQYIINPPNPWNDGAISAHANAAEVALFLRNTLKRNGIDNLGSPLISSVNCIIRDESPDGQQWNNAAWFSGQMVYGQKKVDGKLRSYSVGIDVVAHEIFHGITDKTARLEYAVESGALNESYSDIFGILVSNLRENDISKWNWEMGEDLNKDGIPLRSLEDPTKFNQPAKMDDYKNLPNTRNGDWGGVHINSGIHNFAAYKIMTAKNAPNTFLFTPETLAALFYLALTQYLTRNSTFGESRRAIEIVAKTLFRNDIPTVKKAKLKAITDAFDAVGIDLE